ncbi:type IV pilus assembly protein FimV [Colwellia sp. TT2012]|uniref:type IV pilus assembly protein FimV n=1 Tax=Colwellia sp. TT2012 TaxID=1720342 RepID=UPI00070F60FC|nr:hypothetical protein [Colwellia sp. TT2012]
MKFRITNTLAIIFFTLFPFNSFAQIEYISLHDVESANSQALSVKLNIVENGQQLPLKFILTNQQTRTTLSSQRINNYMLRLKGPSKVSGRAVIHVYQLEMGAWRRVKGINISSSLTPFTATKLKAPVSAKINKTAVPTGTTVKVTPTIRQEKSKADCILTRQRKETLWNIANRYKEQWKIDVFSAMIAIYKSNMTTFSKQHIGQLMAHYPLNCPSKRMLNAMGTKAQMKTEFHRLNALPLN